jgi:hypothetical protein
VTLVTNTADNTTRYSDTVSAGKLELPLYGDETKAYLVVCATPDEIKNFNVDWDSVVTDSDTRYTYKVKIEFEDTLLGDVDGKGSVNKTDATLLLRYLLGLENDDKINTSVADCDGVDGIDIRDVIWILSK